MIMNLILLLILLIAAIKEVRNMSQANVLRKNAFALSLFGIAVVLVVVRLFGLDPPNPINGINFVFKPISSKLDEILR